MSSQAQNLFNLFLKLFTLGALTTFSGRQFQSPATLRAKEYFLKLFVALCVKSVLGFPLGPVLGAITFQSLRNWVAFLSYTPFMILNTSIMSPLNLRYDSVGSFSSLSLSGYGLSFTPGYCLVALLCTASSWSTCLSLYGLYTELA